MATESVTRCDGCGGEERGDVRDWLRLESHGTQTGEGRTWWVSGGACRAAPPFHFHRLGCLREWEKRQEH